HAGGDIPEKALRGSAPRVLRAVVNLRPVRRRSQGPQRRDPMLVPPLLLATLALQVAPQFQGADPEPPAARTVPADSSWEQGQGGAQATDALRGWDLAVGERGLRVSPTESAEVADRGEQP